MAKRSGASNIAVACGVFLAISTISVAQPPAKNEEMFSLSSSEIRQEGSTLVLKGKISIVTRWVEIKANEAEVDTQTHEVKLLDAETTVRLRRIRKTSAISTITKGSVIHLVGDVHISGDGFEAHATEADVDTLSGDEVKLRGNPRVTLLGLDPPSKAKAE